ncbi:MAG: endonuclease I family protein [Pseudobdellovibrionaceae bacterium]
MCFRFLFILATGLLLNSFNAYALNYPSSGVIPYYGERLYLALKGGARDVELLKNIKEVLKSKHLQINNGQDQIVSSCGSAKQCYSHFAVGYDNARIFLMGQFYLVGDGNNYAVKDVYCSKEYSADDFGGGTKPGPNKVPDSRFVNTEHTWPQSRFSNRYDNGLQKSDLHHLFPTDSELNSIRGSFKFGEVTRDRMILKCPVSRFGSSSTSGDLVFEPPKVHRGNVARALFYFSTRYDLPIDSNEESTLKKWNKEDPVDLEELDRQEKIFQLQGNRNPFIDYPGMVDLIGDF